MNESNGTVAVANAPVSFGVFELTVRRIPLLRGPALLDALVTSGYQGVDLGPPGYLAEEDALVQALDERGLGLAGGWVDLRFSDADGFREDMATLERLLPLFGAAAALAAERGLPPPMPTLADSGSKERRANPGRGGELPELRLEGLQWDRFAGRVQEAADRVRAAGLEPTFHHHACTYVEAPVEIERLLRSTDVGLCLDSGHLLLGGGDPRTAWAAWRKRVNHLHVKDCHLDVLRASVARGAGLAEVWESGVFCGLGKGDLDVGGFLDDVLSSDFSGWLVVEQDVIPAATTTVADLIAAQAANREELRRHGI